MQMYRAKIMHVFSKILHKMKPVPFAVICLSVCAIFIFSACNQPVDESTPEIAYILHRPYQAVHADWERIPEATFVYPTGKPFISAERQEYVSGSMTLEVPRIGYSGPVLDAVDDYTLTLGIGLYDYSPLPGPLWYNANISIAGHRDVYGYEFYYVDTITDGDELYLIYDNLRYTYVYDSTKIIEDDDWSVIFCTGYPTLTLTSCHPIGTSDYRIVVKARLTEITSL